MITVVSGVTEAPSATAYLRSVPATGALTGVPLPDATGAAAGAGAGAAAIYSALGIAAASGPAGWVVAGVGVAIYGIFSLFGWGVKKVVQSDRADKTKRQISPKIDEIESSLLKAISEKYADFATSCTNSLDAILKYREEELVNLKKTLSRVVDDEQEVVLKNDLDYIINKQKEL